MRAADAEAWRAQRYARTARFVTDLGAPLLDLLDARPGERVLDLGCGDGAMAGALMAAGAEVLGVDASPDMVAAARARGVDARLGRGEALDFAPAFDAVLSNAAMHWMPDQDAVIAAVAAALKPGGRFVAEMGGRGNVAGLRVALSAALLIEAGLDDDLSGVWAFPSEEDQRARLEDAGFRVDEIALFPRPTPLPAGGRDWFETLAAPVLALAPEERRAAVAERAARLAAAALSDAAGRWTADYVRLRFRATRLG